jgi:NADPH:quinone reductase-like Zn-dependent oxidoreductase
VVQPDAPGLPRLAALAAAGRLVPEIAETVPLAGAARAHRMLEAGVGRGKIVLVTDPGGEVR